MLLPARLYKRSLDANKGDFGHVFILAGSRRLTGAACLCAQAAMRAGAGAVTLGIPKSLHPVIASKITEVMTYPLPETEQATLAAEGFHEIKTFLKKTDCVLLGPGLSENQETQRLIRSLMSCIEAPMVIDADGLNALAGHLDILTHAKGASVLTPHPKEMARLWDISVEQVQNDRKKVAKDFALRYNSTLVLKGSGTVVASPQGGLYVNKSGNPGMATAGSGDVLSGIIAAFLAQGLVPFDAARYGVYIHGLAGDLAAKDMTEISLIASDIIEYLPAAFKLSRQSSVVRRQPRSDD